MKKKYKVGRDLQKFAEEYNTVSPSELVKIVYRERGKTISDNSVTMWFKRHPDVYYRLIRLVETNKEPLKQLPEVIAKLVSEEYGNIEIINLDTLEYVKKLLAKIECDIKAQIYNQEKLPVIREVALIQCTNCTGLIPQNSIFCPNCGTRRKG